MDRSKNISVPAKKSHWLRKLINFKPPDWTYQLIIGLTLPSLICTLAYLLVGNSALPGGQIFAIFVLEIVGIAFGHVFSLIRLPPLLGMLLVGILCRNAPQIDFESALTSELSSALRQMALAVILIRAGLGLDPEALMRLKGVVIRLAFCPCLAEALTIAMASHFILGFPILWGLLLGFVLAAVSPAVIVPSLLHLSQQGYGLDKGIPTIVIAASSMDDILAISAFGIVLGFNFSQGNNLFSSIIHGPLEVLLGITFGLFWGALLGIFVAKSHLKGNRNDITFRIFLTLGVGLLAVFGFPYIGYPGAGPLGCLTASFITAMFWRAKSILKDNDTLSWAFSILWLIFQPLLFGLIGCEIDLWDLDWNVVGLGVICLTIGLTVRLFVTYLSTANSGLNFKERIFVAIAWVPKATVQAAIGPIALDTARQLNAGHESEQLGLQVLTIAVLVILITAPIGATAVMTLGPKLLSRSDKSVQNCTEMEDKTCVEEQVVEPLAVSVDLGIESQLPSSTN